MKGFFEDALPQLDPDRRFCFVHIDADLYSSVLCALEQLYDRVVAGGVIAIDDFFHPGQGPVRATAEFFNSRGLTPLYHVGFPYSVFVIKEDWGRVLRSLDGNAYSLEWLRSDDYFLATFEAQPQARPETEQPCAGELHPTARHPAGRRALPRRDLRLLALARGLLVADRRPA